jgi:hypothetical protein
MVTGEDSKYGNVAFADQLEYINYDSPVPIVKEGYDIPLNYGVMMETGFPNNATDCWLWDWARDGLNLDLHVEQILDTEKFNLLFASNQVPDLMYDVPVSTTMVVNYGVVEGMLTDYSKYLDGYMPAMIQVFERYPDCRAMYTAGSEGQLYDFPRILTPATIVGSHYNKYILDTLGLPVPTTIDEFEANAIAMRDADPAQFEGMDWDDIIPIGGGYNSEWACPMGVLTEAMGYLVRGYWKGWNIGAGYKHCLRLNDDGSDNRYGFPCNDDLYYDFMTIQNRWYEEELFSPDYFTMDGAEARAHNANGNVGWANTSEGWGSSPLPRDSYRILAPLKSQWMNNPVSACYPIYGNSGMYIGPTEYPEVCCRWFDLHYNTEWDYYFKWGPIEGDPKVDDYGYVRQVWGVNPLRDPPTGLEECYYPGYAPKDDYRNTASLVPTYNDQALLDWDFYARRTSAVKGEYVEPDTPEIIKARARENYESDPVTFASSADCLGIDWPYSYWEARGWFAGGRYEPLNRLYLNPDDNQTVADLDAVLSPYIQEQAALFISGRRPLSEITNFQEEIRSMGIGEYEEILQTAYANYLAALG